MLASPDDPRKTRPLPSIDNTWQSQTPTMPGFPSPVRSGPLFLSQTSSRLPTVIPAAKRGTRARRLAQPRFGRPHKRLAWIIVLIAGSLTSILTFAFAVPLGNSQQKPVTLVQGIGNLITTGQFDAVNTAQHYGQPTPSLGLLREGYCGGTDLWGACAKALLDNGTLGTGKMQRPIQGSHVSQVFGNPEYQSWCGCIKPHNGIDLAADYGTPITAADNGEIIWAGWDWSGLGWAVKISHGNFISTVYGHMARYTVKPGQYVTGGQVIGYEGSTGASTGPHVHFMVLVNNIWMNPANYIQFP